MSLAGKIARNSIVLAVGEVLRTVLSFVAVFFLARYLGVHDFGVFNYAFAYLYFFEMLPRFGFDPIVGRELAKGGPGQGILLGNAIVLRLALAVLATVLALAGTCLLGKDARVMGVMALASLSLFFTLQINYETVLRTELVMARAVFINLAKQVLYLLMVVAGVVLHAPLWYFVLVSLIAGAGSLWMYRRVAGAFVRPVWQWDNAVVKRLLWESWPVAVSSLCGAILMRSGFMFLEAYKGFEAVGKYSAAFKLVEALALIPTAWTMSLFPLLSRAFQQDPVAFRRTAYYGLKFLLIAALPLCLTISFFSPEIIQCIYGKKYAGAETILRLLVWVAVFFFPNHLFANLNFATGNQRVELAIRGVCCVVSLGLNAFLVPRISYLGCAIAWIADEALYCLFSWYFLAGYLKLKNEKWIRFGVCLAALNGALLGFYALTPAVFFPWMSILGLSGFTCLLFALGVFDVTEKDLMRKAAQGVFRSS